MIVLLLLVIISAVLIYLIPFHISLLSINVLAFIAFGADKYKSKSNSYRTSESLLLALCLMGGWIGGAFAMFTFRHKTRKISFLLLWLLTVVANIIILVKLNASS